MTSKQTSENWTGPYEFTFNRDNSNIYNRRIQTDSKNYFIALSNYISEPQNVLSLDADPVTVKKICFGPGENWFCRHQDSVCFTKD
jgi:hypothetical protein